MKPSLVASLVLFIIKGIHVTKSACAILFLLSHLTVGCMVQMEGSAQMSIAMGPAESDASLRDMVKKLSEQMERAVDRQKFMKLSEDVERLSKQMELGLDRLDKCSCAALTCLPLMTTCDVSGKRKCCPAANKQAECRIIGSDKNPKCCIGSRNRCADVEENGEKQCCDPDESCIFKGSLSFHVCGNPTGNQECLRVGESCAERSCCDASSTTTFFNTTCAPVEIRGTKSLRCCVAHGDKCNPRLDHVGQCCNRSETCKRAAGPQGGLECV